MEDKHGIDTSTDERFKESMIELKVYVNNFFESYIEHFNKIFEQITDNSWIEKAYNELTPYSLALFGSNVSSKYREIVEYLEKKDEREGLTDEEISYLTYFSKLSKACNEYSMKYGSDLNAQIDYMKAVIPDKTLLDNTKVSKSMKKIVTNNRNIPMTVNVGNKKNNNECFVFVDIEDNNDIAISGGKFTAIDQANLRAVEDLFMAGNKYFTADMVYRARKGYTNAGGVSPQAIASVQNSINKMSNIRITIDYTNQYKLWYPDKDFSKSQFKKTEALLPLGIATVKVSGVEKTAYYLLKEPLLYEYAKTFKQVITLPSNLLNTKDVICRSSGDEDDVIVQYLLTRISIMKNKKNNTGNKITYRFFDESKGKNGEYTGIFVEVGFKDVEPSANKARKLRDRTKDILTSFKNKGFITGFKEYKQKDKKTYAGIEIFY